MTWDAWAAGEVEAIRAAGRWRAPRTLDARGPEGILADDATGTAVVSFASNDYLGLTAHPAVVAAAHDALDRWGAGAGSARLIVGARPVHAELERELAEWKGMPRAALFPTGFATNLGVITTFAGAGVLVCSDELNHASIIDGCRLTRGDSAVFRHRDLDHLGALLREHGARRALVVSDTVFSMDGDLADTDALLDLCAREGALLVVDEAHAVLGPDLDVPDGLDVLRVGTLSKTLGALGGFVAGPARAIELVENLARPYIFATAPTPADTAAALAALRIVRAPEGAALVSRLRAHVDRLRPGHPSPIVPFVCGAEARALEAAALLLDQGLLVPAIRPPTVPAGTSRLRVTVSAAHTDAQVERLVRALSDALGPLPGSVTVVAVAGTGTEVGKTYVAAALLRTLRAAGTAVTARKPVQSFAPGDDTRHLTDADLLAAASGEAAQTVCPPHRRLARPLAPPMAADALGLVPFTIGDLARETLAGVPADPNALVLVETAGGVGSPIASDGDSAALIAALAPRLVILVADAGLGTINLVRLSTGALARHHVVVYLNRFAATDDLHARNAEWLTTREGLDVVTDVEALATFVEPGAGPR